MKKLALISILILTTIAIGQVGRPYKPPVVKNLSSPYIGDLYSSPTLHYDISTNLVTNSVGEISIDAYGRVWTVGGNVGASVMDGENLYHFGSEIGFFDRLTTIDCDNEGKIWIGGNGIGVYCLSQGLIVKHYTNSPIFPIDSTSYDIGDVHIRGLTSDSKGNAWVATNYNGISFLGKDTSIWWGTTNGLMENGRVSEPVLDSNDVCWFMNEGVIYYIDNFELFEYPLMNLIKGAKVLSGNGLPYIFCTTNDGLVYKLFKDKVELIEASRDLFSNDAVTKVGKDKRIYFKQNGKIYEFINDEFELLFDNYGDFGIRDFDIDAQGRIWVGSSGGNGIYQIPHLGIKRYPQFKMSGNYNNGHLIVSNNQGMFFEIKPGTEERLTHHITLNKETKNDNIVVDNYGVHYLTSDGDYFFDFEKETLIKEPNIHYLEAMRISRYADRFGIVRENKFSVVDKNGIGEEIELPNLDDARLIYSKDSLHYLLGYNGKETNANIIKVDKGKIDTLFNNIGGDSIRITGGMYINDTTFQVLTWGLYMIQITPNTNTLITEGLGTNILFNYQFDNAGNMWASGIEGGVNYIDKHTGKPVNFSNIDGFPGTKAGFGMHPTNNDVISSSQSGLVTFSVIDSSIKVNNKEDFFKKYKIEIYRNNIGLYGENFMNSQLTNDGKLMAYGTGGFPQIIDPKNLNQRKPSHLHFKRIFKEDENRNSKGIYQWYPGMKYKEVEAFQIDYTENITVDISSIFFEDYFNQSYAYQIDSAAWSAPNHSNHFRIAGLSSGEHRISFMALSSSGIASETISFNVFVKGPIYEKAWFWLIIIAILSLLFYGIYRWRTVILRERAQKLERTVDERTAEINLQKIEIETQHEEIKDSINYAKRLQDAIFPSDATINKYLTESFVFFQPKDVVSGDFYWFERYNNTSYLAVADCTGHGVPGALVSVVCSNALNRTINEFKISEPAEILNKTRELVIESFSKTGINVKDGMDIALCAIHQDKLIFSGANNPIWIVRKLENITNEEKEIKGTIIADSKAIVEVKGDKQPVGIHDYAKDFSQTQIDIFEGDQFYLFSDGYPDQFGGEKDNNVKPGGKKLKYKPFKKIILESSSLPLDEQGQFLKASFEKWKGSFEQVDDVCVIGFRL